MASALSHSRDFLAHSLARVRAGFGHLGAGEGPPIHVEPFDAHNASTSAGLVKLVTSVAAAHRAKANFAASQQDAELKREATRAQIAEIRSHAKYYEQGGGRAAAGGAVTSMPFTVGGKTYPAGTPRGDVTLARGVSGDAERAGRVGKVTAAQAALKGIDTQIAREAQAHAAAAMARLDPYVSALTGDDPDVARHAAAVIRNVTASTRTDVMDAKTGRKTNQIGVDGLDLSPYMTPATQDDKGKWTVTPLKNSEVVARQNVARAELQKALEARSRAMLEQRYGGQRASHQATIDEMARTGGAEPTPIPEQAPAPPTDPLDVGAYQPTGP